MTTAKYLTAQDKAFWETRDPARFCTIRKVEQHLNNNNYNGRFKNQKDSRQRVRGQDDNDAR
jgi:hypothetical protein